MLGWRPTNNSIAPSGRVAGNNMTFTNINEIIPDRIKNKQSAHTQQQWQNLQQYPYKKSLSEELRRKDAGAFTLGYLGTSIFFVAVYLYYLSNHNSRAQQIDTYIQSLKDWK